MKIAPITRFVHGLPATAVGLDQGRELSLGAAREPGQQHSVAVDPAPGGVRQHLGDEAEINLGFAAARDAGDDAARSDRGRGRGARAPRAHRLQGGRHQLPRRGEDQGTVELDWWCLAGVAGPLGTPSDIDWFGTVVVVGGGVGAAVTYREIEIGPRVRGAWRPSDRTRDMAAPTGGEPAIAQASPS